MTQIQPEVFTPSSSFSVAPPPQPAVATPSNDLGQEQQQLSPTQQNNNNIDNSLGQPTGVMRTARTDSSLPPDVDPKLLRPTQRFLAALDRAKGPPEKERLLFRFAAVLDQVFYDVQPSAPSSRDGTALERDIQALLEAVFVILQMHVEEEHTVEPPARFAALRALGAFVQGTAPIPTVLSEDWKQNHVPMHLAALRLLSKLFERGTTQFVFAVRCLSVMAIQALQVLQPLDPVDMAVSSVLSSPSRNRGGLAGSRRNNNNSSSSGVNAAGDDSVVNYDDVSNHASSAAAHEGGAGGGGSPVNTSDAIMQASATGEAASAAVQPLNLPSGSSLRMTVGSPTAATQNTMLAVGMSGTSAASPIDGGASFLDFETLYLDHLLTDPVLRPIVLELWRTWDAAGIDIRVFTACPEALHVYMPQRLLSSVSCVYRDFVTCPPRPRMDKPWKGLCEIHVKTNIKARSEVMFRILVEGYNYGVNAPIQSEVVGCAKRHWDAPAGGDAEALGKMCKDHGSGCISTQYFSSDGFLVVKLVATSFFGVGFTASAWMIFHGHSPGFPIEAEVFHQEENL